MRKLKLDMDALVVESFEAGGARERVGTVRGHGPLSQGCPVKFTENEYSELMGSCGLECTQSCGLTNCPGDCAHGQTLGATCACPTFATCAPDETCSLEC